METEPIPSNPTVPGVPRDGEPSARYVVRPIGGLGSHDLRALSLSFGKRCLGTHFIEPIHYRGSDPLFSCICDDLCLCWHARATIRLMDCRVFVSNCPSRNPADPERDPVRHPRMDRSRLVAGMESNTRRRAFGWILRLLGRRDIPMDEHQTLAVCSRHSEYSNAAMARNGDDQTVRFAIPKRHSACDRLSSRTNTRIPDDLDSQRRRPPTHYRTLEGPVRSVKTISPSSGVFIERTCLPGSHEALTQPCATRVSKHCIA